MFSQMKYVLGVLLSLSLVSESYAVGGAFIGNEVPSARSAGQGYVGVAGQSDDPTTVFSNPAAMTNLKGTQLTVGSAWENIHGGYQDNAGNQTKERVTNAGVPNASATHSFLDGKLGAGLSVQSPFGLESYWPGNSPLRYVATDSRLDMVDITPAVAYQVIPMVSVGAGVDYFDVFNAQLSRAVNVNAVNTALGAPTATAADASTTLSGQSTNWGYHGGVLLQPNEKNAFGITYHSKVDLRVLGNAQISGMTGAMAQVFGGSNYSTSAFTDLVLPESVQFGYAFKPTDKWMLEADAAWYNWASAQDINIRYAETNPVRLAVLNQGNPIPLSLHNSWSMSTGANYKVNDKWQVRSGFWYEPWAMPDVNFSPGFLDLSRYGLNIGAGYAFNEHVTLDAAYGAIFTHNRTINNNVGTNTTGIPGYNIDGTYSNFANTVMMNLSYRY